MPVKVKSVDRTPSEVNPASLLKTNVKTTIEVTGRIIAQLAPRSVCLYSTFTSRQIKK